DLTDRNPHDHPHTEDGRSPAAVRAPTEGRAPMIRVLVVDDSVVIRRLVTQTLERDPDITVVGTAADGRLALAKVAQLDPDVVTLDIEMPRMNGIETVAALRAAGRR